MKEGLKNRISYVTAVFLLFVVLQALFWLNTKDKKPEWVVMPEVPSDTMINAMSFGDRQFLFRVLGFQLQNAGDGWGRQTPLIKYDYSKVKQWFDILDGIDSESNYIAALAAYYFGVTPKTEDVRYVIDFLRSHVRKNPAKKWRWLAHASYLARHRLKDQELALEIAKELAALDVPNMPIWTRQMPAFILANMGEKEAARTVMLVILGTTKDIPDNEKRFMLDYIDRYLE